MTNHNLFAILDLIPTLTFPDRIAAYTDPIKEEIRYQIHTYILLGKQQRVNTNPYYFIIYGAEKFLEYYTKRKRVKYYSALDLCPYFKTAKSSYHRFVRQLEEFKKNKL